MIRVMLCLVTAQRQSHRTKLTAVTPSRGGLRSEATTGARRTKLAVNLWSGAETR